MTAYIGRRERRTERKGRRKRENPENPTYILLPSSLSLYLCMAASLSLCPNFSLSLASVVPYAFHPRRRQRGAIISTKRQNGSTGSAVSGNIRLEATPFISATVAASRNRFPYCVHHCARRVPNIPHVLPSMCLALYLGTFVVNMCRSRVCVIQCVRARRSACDGTYILRTCIIERQSLYLE